MSQLLCRDLCPVTELYQTFLAGASVVVLFASIPIQDLNREGEERRQTVQLYGFWSSQGLADLIQGRGPIVSRSS